MRGEAQKQTKLTKICKVPIKILCKARDFYVKGMNGLAAPAASLSKSYSVNSINAVDDEDFRQLLRAASTRITDGKSQPNGMARCYSVSVGKIGRIEEDKPCAFVEDAVKANLLYPRSRSHAVKRKFV
ncbi:hypothetical protein CUMW_114260 [Citrus unshiu]|uniref:Uncharacterized protein n=1 Tax=Citrus sinensis TaxID=2711 RepID=A0ACB8IDB9_CITSI|nr:hypothetical protein KPL71_022625 [Citrus sinensis]GAY48767.1 hypothetical protein CUMW_114260 [Citrus unshiu]